MPCPTGAHPSSQLAVPVLPDGVDEVGAEGEVLGVLDAAVEQAHLGVDQPVAPAVRVVVEVLLPLLVLVHLARNWEEIQSDTSRCFKPPVDFDVKVVF